MVSIVFSVQSGTPSFVQCMIRAVLGAHGGDIMHLIRNATLPKGITCSSSSYSVECSSAEEILTLTTPPCTRSLVVVVKDASRQSVLVSAALFSNPKPQRIQYSVQGATRELNFTVQVGACTSDHFYVISLDGSSIGLRLPLTSVPLQCLSQSMINSIFYFLMYESSLFS